MGYVRHSSDVTQFICWFTAFTTWKKDGSALDWKGLLSPPFFQIQRISFHTFAQTFYCAACKSNSQARSHSAQFAGFVKRPVSSQNWFEGCIFQHPSKPGPHACFEMSSGRTKMEITGRLFWPEWHAKIFHRGETFENRRKYVIQVFMTFNWWTSSLFFICKIMATQWLTSGKGFAGSRFKSNVERPLVNPPKF